MESAGWKLVCCSRMACDGWSEWSGWGQEVGVECGRGNWKLRRADTSRMDMRPKQARQVSVY